MPMITTHIQSERCWWLSWQTDVRMPYEFPGVDTAKKMMENRGMDNDPGRSVR